MEELGRGLVRVQQLDLAAVARRLEQPLPPYVVRVDAGVPGGLVRDWPEPGFGREKHLGYAFQWFAMAAAVVILYVALNLRRKQRHE
jgi:cytochrome oxidase assembly protein ShyY1